MKDQNQRQRHHIRAARDWLGKAEHSLEEDNEVRGELKVMLAKAELAQAQQGTGPLRKWGRRLLPAAVALLIAGCGWLGFQLAQPGRLSVPATENVAGAPETPAPVRPPAEEDPPPAAAEDTAPQEPASFAAAGNAAQKPAPVSATDAAPQPAAQEQPAVASAPRKAAAVPNDDMQKLMQTAGKALRQ